MGVSKRSKILSEIFKHGNPKSPLYRLMFHPGKRGGKPPATAKGGKGERAIMSPSVRTQTDAAKKKSGTDYLPSDSLDSWSASQKKDMLDVFKKVTPDYRSAKSSEDVVEVFADNIRHLLEQMTPEDRENAKKSAMWYVAGSKLSEELGSTVTNRHADAVGAAVIAVLSPKNDWSNNVGQAAHLFDLWTSDDPVGDDVLDRAVEIAIAELDSKIEKDKERLAKGLAELDVWKRTGISSSGKTKKTKSMIDSREKELSELADRVKLDEGSHSTVRSMIMNGGALKDFDESVQQYVFRASIDVGDLTRVEMTPNEDGTYKLGGDLGVLTSPMPALAEKALNVLRSADGLNSGTISDDEFRSIIDVELGKGSKVRSFYTNLYDPFDETQKAVTVDTHMGAAVNLLPIAADSTVVNMGIFSPNAGRGMGQAYPLYAEATRAVAEELGLSPRALQSVVWDYQLLRYGGSGGSAKEAFTAEHGIRTAMILDRLGIDALREWDNLVVPLWRKQNLSKDTKEKNQIKNQIRDIASTFDERMKGTKGLSRKAIASLVVPKKAGGDE